jgi:carbonic anhydrase
MHYLYSAYKNRHAITNSSHSILFKKKYSSFREKKEKKKVLAMCCVELRYSMWCTYEGESKIIRNVATYCAVGYTAG